MLIFAVMAGMAVVWLWLFPPDALSDRARQLLLGTGVAVCAGTLWLTTHFQSRMLEARTNARTQYHRSERKKRELMQLMLKEQQELGAQGIYRP